MPSTLVEKIIARASGRTRVEPGKIVTCKVDLAMFYDSAGPRRIEPALRELGAQVWDPSRVVVAGDHFAPSLDAMPPAAHRLRPGAFCVSGDGQFITGGAFGCYMAGFGGTEMTGVMITGKIWTRVPETVLVYLSGELPVGTTAKDITLALCRLLGMRNNFKVIEYAGSTVASLPMNERMALTNMAVELGAETGLIAPDAVTLDAIRSAGGVVEDDAVNIWQSDPDASYEFRCEIDVSSLEPQIAWPRSSANIASVTEARGQRIDQACVGACVGANLADLHMAARVLKGRKVAPGVRLLIAPASIEASQAATADGTMATLAKAGAILLRCGSGARSGISAGTLAKGEVGISSTNRNFKALTGQEDADVYLGSPYTVAASAVEGRIADPRIYLEGEFYG
jgi:3-isopropylmalate/(R)-2-methylmalate dehydratase large subunit